MLTSAASSATSRRVLRIIPKRWCACIPQGTNGKMIDVTQCATIGCQHVSGGMMESGAGGMMNNSWGSGMMGAGWKASDGTFGMLFTFTTT